MGSWHRGWCLICGLSLVVGCGSPATSPDSPQALSSADVVKPPADAAAVVMTFAGAMRDGKIEHAYDLLPASYQKDVDELVHEFAGQMDSELWTAGFGVLEKATGLLKTKKELLISMAKQPGRESQTEQLSVHWDGLVSGLEKFTASDLSQVEKLKAGSSRDLLQKGVGPLAKSLMAIATFQSESGATTLADLDKVKAEVLESTDSTAKVKITSPAKDEPETVEFTKVDGKWIPTTMAEKWSENIRTAREQIKSIDPDTITAQKPRILQVMTTANGVIDEMMKAETADQIQQAAFPLMLQAMMMSSQMGGNSKPKPKSPPAAQVTILVAQDLSEEDREKLEVALKELVDDPSLRSITTTKVDGKTIVTVAPVADIEAFARKLTMAKELEIDADNKAITVEKIAFE